MNLILATNNQEKITEFRRILRGYFSSMEGIDIFGIKSEPDENGMSFYCSTKKILSMSKFVAKTSKDNLPDMVSASSEE